MVFQNRGHNAEELGTECFFSTKAQGVSERSHFIAELWGTYINEIILRIIVSKTITRQLIIYIYIYIPKPYEHYLLLLSPGTPIM